jgi:uncharacterized protein YaiI (UPF0178 family)
MKLWIDSDACPRPVKEVVFRAGERLDLEVVVVANSFQNLPRTGRVKFIQVEKHLDAADAYIVQNLAVEDVIITADVPLAGLVVDKGAVAINPRGDLYTAATVSERLSIRNFMQDLRSCGAQTGGPASYSDRDKHKFASTLDAILQKKLRNSAK